VPFFWRKVSVIGFGLGDSAEKTSTPFTAYSAPSMGGLSPSLPRMETVAKGHEAPRPLLGAHMRRPQVRPLGRTQCCFLARQVATDSSNQKVIHRKPCVKYC
jgi:hypothetical protein